MGAQLPGRGSTPGPVSQKQYGTLLHTCFSSFVWVIKGFRELAQNNGDVIRQFAYTFYGMYFIVILLREVPCVSRVSADLVDFARGSISVHVTFITCS
jgi:hypothetical protein